jgi:hypothetical protein
MDGISNQIIAISSQMAAAKLAQGVQVYVLRQSMEMQEASVMTLLQPAAGPQPLATSGSLGTQLNVYA